MAKIKNYLVKAYSVMVAQGAFTFDKNDIMKQVIPDLYTKPCIEYLLAYYKDNPKLYRFMVMTYGTAVMLGYVELMSDDEKIKGNATKCVPEAYLPYVMEWLGEQDDWDEEEATEGKQKEETV